MAGELPGYLRAAIERRLEGVSRNDLARRAAAMSDRYRGGGGSRTALISDADITAYLVTRMPATYAATAAVLSEVARRAPGFAPATMIDAGAGPGTASFAANAPWPALGSVTMLDASPRLLETAATLAADSGSAALADARRLTGDMATVAMGEADLVVAAYALAEVPAARLAATVAHLWAATRGVLVLVEPGTPAGFERIRAARAALIAAGGEIVAPCPHALACPIIAPDWCHFAVRLSRSRDHRLVKEADAPFEDEKYSYVAVARPGVPHDVCAARVLAPTHISKAALTAKLCVDDGTIATRTVARRDAEAFRRWRRLDWGDAVEAG